MPLVRLLVPLEGRKAGEVVRVDASAAQELLANQRAVIVREQRRETRRK
jgi:hypothetical protein